MSTRMQDARGARLAHGAPIVAALRTIPPAIAAFHTRVTGILADDLALAGA